MLLVTVIMASTEGWILQNHNFLPISEPVAIFKKRKSSAIRKRDDDDGDDSFSGSAVVRAAKSHKENPFVQSTTREAKGLDRAFASSRSAAAAGSGDAYATAINVLAAEENEQIRDKTIPVNEDGIYRGMKSYKEYAPKGRAQAGLAAGGISAGPLKAPVFIRQACRFDYQPDLCKDYKETGFCGFGGMFALEILEYDSNIS